MMVYDVFMEAIPPTVTKLVFATLLGLFIGLEREWSNKPAGIRTFALISLLGAVFTVVGIKYLPIFGVVFISILTVLLGVRAIVNSDDDAQYGLSLTTSVSMLVAYGIGVMVASDLFLEAVVIAAISSLLLVLKRELHTFSSNLSKDEIQSAVEFAIIAFVVYPLLPDEPFGPWNSIDARLAWLLVIAVSGIGFVNYVLIRRYEGVGFWFTGFIGGLVNSTAVIASLSERVGDNGEGKEVAVGAILLANAAMATRNAVILAIFIPSAAVNVAIPLGAIAVVGVILSFFVGDWGSDFKADLESPFSTKSALTFGGLFAVILILSAAAQNIIGNAGFLGTTFLAGLVSSGSATTTAVTLVSSNQISAALAAYGVVVGTVASIIVKAGFVAVSERRLFLPVALWSTVLIVTGLVAASIITII